MFEPEEVTNNRRLISYRNQQTYKVHLFYTNFKNNIPEQTTYLMKYLIWSNIIERLLDINGYQYKNQLFVRYSLPSKTPPPLCMREKDCELLVLQYISESWVAIKHPVINGYAVIIVLKHLKGKEFWQTWSAQSVCGRFLKMLYDVYDIDNLVLSYLMVRNMFLLLKSINFTITIYNSKWTFFELKWEECSVYV